MLRTNGLNIWRAVVTVAKKLCALVGSHLELCHEANEEPWLEKQMARVEEKNQGHNERW